ncbi:hypothetical protein [Planobispora takensis]|uniref:Uncharacterized protein n=1 Tax=Planobispora takensis TaxID=1367882 RepID=A0A8J3WWJ6_9ACTN|nr:hypothetical protein [Planobispora takensis]GII05064.1 hypothetical protein Pta02_70720 [Planobispora takensis]
MSGGTVPEPGKAGGPDEADRAGVNGAGETPDGTPDEAPDKTADETPDGADVTALLDLPSHELRAAVSRALAARLLPRLLALPDDRLRDVLCEALAERRPYDYSPGQETRIFLAVTGPAPKRKAPGWRHRAVAPSLPRLAARRRPGTLAYRGECPVCGTPLCADTGAAACPVCGTTEARLSR